MNFKKSFKDSPRGIKTISIIYYFATISYLAISIIAFTNKELLKKIPDISSANIPINQLSLTIGILFFGLTIFSFFIATGLIKKQKWARIALIIFSLLNVLGGINSIINKNFLSAINLAFNLIIMIYLIFSKKVKFHFKNKQNEKLENFAEKKEIKPKKNNLKKILKKIKKDELKKIKKQKKELKKIQENSRKI